jgi:two-component system sensor histidine kinase MtrB
VRARDRPSPADRRVPRLGLRARVTLAFGLLALALSAVLSLVAWTAVSSYLVVERESTALVETALDQSAFQAGLDVAGTGVPELLGALPTNGSTAAIALVDGRWYATRPGLGPSVLPAELVDVVRSRQEATQRVRVDGDLFLVVGVPLEQSDAAFFEVFALDELARTVRTLSWSLTAAAIGTAGVGLLLGSVASRVALRPLASLNEVAAAVAGGHLGARLPTTRDPDLGPLAISFNRTIGELEHRVAADSRFAVDVSHELRTPLTTMLNSIQVIKNREDTLPPAVREPVDLLADDLERFRALVVDLLAISRHDAGDQLVLDEVVVGDLVRRAADEAAGRSVTTVRPDAAAVTMRADKRRLERVVANLVRNADTHGRGCERVTVDATFRTVRIVVDDCGPGVPAEQRGRIFDRFSRASSGDRSGVGLGLAIVQRHVVLHGGKVVVTERPGGGARFVVELPRSR